MAVPAGYQALVVPEAVEPDSWSGIELPGGVTLRRPRDPILRSGLTRYVDEREWDHILQHSAIATSLGHLITPYLGEEIEVQAGPSSTPAAEVLRQEAAWVWGSIPRSVRRVLMHEVCMAGWRGWSAVQAIPTMTSYRGRSYAAPGRLIDKPVSRLRWTDEPAPRIAWLPKRTALGGTATLYDPVISEYWWITPRVGTLDDPYGRGLASGPVWVLAKIIEAFGQKFHLKVDREWDALSVELGEGAGERDQLRVALREVAADLELLRRYLNDKNILIHTQRLKAAWAEKSPFITNGISLAQHLHDEARALIEGQTLTASTASSGPSGSTTVHDQIRLETAKARIGNPLEDTLSEWIGGVITFNRSLDPPDPEDMPRLVSRLHLRLTESDLRAIRLSGIPVKGRVVAARLARGLEDAVAPLDTMAPEDVPADPNYRVTGTAGGTPPHTVQGSSSGSSE